MSAKGFWIAFGTGAAIGAAFALLYAPNEGKVTRKKLGRAYDDAGDYLEDAGDYLKDQAERLSKEAASTYKKSKNQLDDSYTKAIDAINEAYSTAKDKLTDVADDTLAQVQSAAKKARSLV